MLREFNQDKETRISEEEKIRQLLYRFEYVGLVEKHWGKIENCFSKHLLGIGIGEQGFVTSIQEVKQVFLSGIKTEDTSMHTLTFGRVEVLMPDEKMAVVCAEVQVNFHRPEDGRTMKSCFQQSLTVIRENGEWKICGLHASSPTVTEEDVEAYPLKFAEKTLASLREKIGEAVYLVEEQYRQAILSDMIAFYIINFTEDRFEKCQLQDDICVYVEPGTPYAASVIEKTGQYVWEEDQTDVLQCLALANIEEAFQKSENEIYCEYRMKAPDGSYLWVRTIIRLIRDVATGDRKGIMYVKNIDEEKQRALTIQEKADYDAMTNLLHKSAMRQKVDEMMLIEGRSSGGVFLMMDTDNFKQINDTYGHPTGDQVLIAIAEILRDSFKDALVARLGGDEFGVFLFGEILSAEMKVRVEKLLQKVRSFGLPEIPQIKISLSIGGVYLSKGSFEDLYSSADVALYEVKRAGKNGVFWIDGENANRGV